MKKVTFQSEGVTLTGNLFLPETYESGQKLPAVIIGGSWITVKEQMAGLYAHLLSKQGFAALAFDFRYLAKAMESQDSWNLARLKLRILKTQ